MQLDAHARIGAAGLTEIRLLIVVLRGRSADTKGHTDTRQSKLASLKDLQCIQERESD